MTTPSAVWSNLLVALKGVSPSAGRNTLSFSFIFRSSEYYFETESFSEHSEIPIRFEYFVRENARRTFRAYIRFRYKGQNPLNVRTLTRRLIWQPAYYPVKGHKLKVVFSWTFDVSLKATPALNPAYGGLKPLPGQVVPLRRKSSSQISRQVTGNLRAWFRKKASGNSARRWHNRSASRVNPVVVNTTYPTELFTAQGPSVTTDDLGEVTYQTFEKNVLFRAVTPDFFSTDRRYLAPLPYSVVYRDIDDAMGYQINHSDDDWSKQEWYGPTRWFYDHPYPLDSSEVPGVKNKAIGKVVGKSGMDVNNILQDGVQWWQLEDLVLGNAKRIVQALLYVKSFNFGKAAAVLFHGSKPRFRPGGGPSYAKSVANNWLEFQYGWKPLLQDIKGLIESYQQYADPDFRVYTVRAGASGRATYTLPLYGPFRASIQWVNGIRAGTLRIEKKTTYQYGISYSLDDPTRAFLAQTGFLNPLDLAWEVLPFSFVVDWFLPVGQYLEGLSNFEGLKFLGGWESVKTIKHKYVILDREWAQYQTWNGKWSTYKVRGFTHERYCAFTRSVLNDWPHMEPPSFKNGLSPVHIQNGIALLVSVFG